MANINWSPEMEVSLFYSMIDHKPVGENKNFHMIFIYEKFNNLSDKKLTIEQLWQHLKSLYDLTALEDNELTSFPNDETEFSLLDLDNNNLNNVSDDSEASLKTINSTSTKNEAKIATTTSSSSSTNNPNKSLNTSTNQTNTKSNQNKKKMI